MNYNRILTIATTVAAIASCTLSEQKTDSPEPFISGQELTVTASFGDTKSRTGRAADGAVLWSPGDQISLFYGSGSEGGSKFTAQITEVAATANFTGTIGVITGGNDVAVEDTYFWATYPYNPSASCNGTSLTTILPSGQIAAADTFADGMFPTLGCSQGLNIGFYSICGGLKITISEEGIKSVTLQGHNHEVLAGTITVGLNADGLPVVNDITDGSETITVSAPEGETFEVGKSYYIILVPTVFENGFTLTFSKGYARAVYDRTKATTIRRSVFGGLTNPDANLEWEMLYVNIPDPNFNAYMIQNFDTNGNGVLDFDEAEAITSISVETDNISSIQGIEYCMNLRYLHCSGTYSSWNDIEQRYIGSGQLTALDVSMNTKLTNLDCSRNQLIALDVSANTKLTLLECDRNQLRALDISANTELTVLYCFENQLTSLDVSANTMLGLLWCNNNQLMTLDISANKKLRDFSCGSNQLTALDISANTKLIKLDCYGNQLTTLDLSVNEELTWVRCDNNQLTALDVNTNKKLELLCCSNNLLTTLDVSANTNLRDFSCGSNQLTALDVSVNTELEQFECSSNQLTTLDLTNNTNLNWMNCWYNQLTALDVSANTELRELYCYGNQLTALDVSANTKLTFLQCSPMNDTFGHNLLGYLYISQGQSIPNVTVYRSAYYVPAETIIMVAPESGGNEGTIDDPLN